MTKNLLDQGTLLTSWRLEETSRRALLHAEAEMRTRIRDLSRASLQPDAEEQHASLLKLVQSHAMPETTHPSYEERETALFELRSSLPPDTQIVLPTAVGEHEDIFDEPGSGDAERIQSFLTTKNVPREDAWVLRHRIRAQNGGSATLASHYWRYRIWVPQFDTSKHPTRALQITPHAFIRGAVSLLAIGNNEPDAWAMHRYYTGTWHYRHAQGYTSPSWSKWRPSYSRFNQEQAPGIVLSSYADDRTYDRTISTTFTWWKLFNDAYPGVSVDTPAKLLPPGLGQSPNPSNLYAYVRPLDVIDFYVRPHTFVDTNRTLSYAQLDLTIDVPFATFRLDVPADF